MEITLHGSHFEIGGVAFGTVPAWKLIKKDGHLMTKEMFEALPDNDKQTLFTMVQHHIDNLGK